MKDKVLSVIIDYYKKTNFMPSVREVQNIMNYKNHNTIYKAFLQLERDGILIHNKEKRKWCLTNLDNEYLKLKVLNEDSYITLPNDNDNYAVYKLDSNNFREENLLKNDYLIIKKTKYLKNYDLGLFFYNNNYHVMNYIYLDGFYMLSDNKNKEVLNKVKIIGKVIGLQRKEINKKRCI